MNNILQNYKTIIYILMLPKLYPLENMKLLLIKKFPLSKLYASKSLTILGYFIVHCKLSKFMLQIEQVLSWQVIF